MDKKESHLEIIQRARLNDWAKWQYQMIILSQMYYMLLHWASTCYLLDNCVILASNACLPRRKLLYLRRMMIKWYSKDLIYNNLYLVDFTSEDANLKTCLFTKTTLGWLWHRRLAHIGMSSLKKLMKNDWWEGWRLWSLRRTSFVVHVKPASKLQILIQQKLSCQPQEC